jgi:serine/threonine-protein kinase
MGAIREGTVVAGKYQIERPLTRGGMGSIWVARHLKLDMPVAVKLMAPALAETVEGRARFEREARAAALIQSPNVAQIHDYGVEDGTPYIVMELLAGEDLGARLHRTRRLSIATIAAIFTQISKALRRAHELGVVHRDLKPANIFLARVDDDEIVKVLDFGIAKLTGTGAAEEATATGLVLGSIHYMSPEQARGVREIDHRSDLWSLAVIAFRAIVGRLPFPGAQMGDVIIKICSEPIPRPSDLAPDLGPDVDAFFARALARDPADRWQTARELADALAHLAATTASLTMSSAPTTATSSGAPTVSQHFATPGFATPAPSIHLDPRASPPVLIAAPSPSPSPSLDPSSHTASHTQQVDPSWLTPAPQGTLGSAHVRSLAPPPDSGRALRIALIAAGAVMTLLACTLLALRLGGDRAPLSPVATAAAARLDPSSEVPAATSTPIPVPSPIPSASAPPPPPISEPPPSASASPALTTAPTAKPRLPISPVPKKINSTLGF